MSRSDASARLLPLEALRGLAAIGVVLHHFAFAFLPHYLMFTPPSGFTGALKGSPLFVLANGKAMVVIFFVLSGYVLSLKGLRPEPGRLLAEAALKRWFRFAPLILLSLLCAYALFHLGLYRYEDVYDLTGNPWLHDYAGLPQTFRPTLADIFYDGLWGSPIHGDDRFNVVLWTMQIEFFGSMIVFALAALLAPTRRWWLWVALPLVAALLAQQSMWFVPFVLGVLGVALRLEQRRLSFATALSLLLFAFYLCGYYYPVGIYAGLADVALDPLTVRLSLFSLGGFLLLVVFTTANPISSRFTGRVSWLLGRISFALYLLHTLAIASFGCWAYVLAGGGANGVASAALACAAVLTPSVWALARFDGWWLRTLSRWHFIGKKATT